MDPARSEPGGVFRVLKIYLDAALVHRGYAPLRWLTVEGRVACRRFHPSALDNPRFIRIDQNEVGFEPFHDDAGIYA